jgi:hypothetical protein
LTLDGFPNDGETKGTLSMNETANETAFVSTRPFLKLNGEPRDNFEDTMTSMVINLPLSGCAHAELHLTNWGLNEGADTPDFLFSDINLGDTLDILMRAGNDSTSVFKGEVTGIEERFGDGAPTLVLLLQDKMHRLARERYSRTFEEQSPDEIVQAIASEVGLGADANVSPITASWHQVNESDLAFLTRLLGRFDIALRLEGETLRARPEEPDASPVQLHAQDSALKVRLLADLNHQPLRTRVYGYNAGTGEAVDHDVDALTPAPAATTAADTLNQIGWPGDEVVPQPFAASSAEAEAYARAHFRRQAKRFVHGDIICQGEAGLRSGREIELDGVSPRLRGTYQVVHCVHRFDTQSGFETHLKVNRPDWRS